MDFSSSICTYSRKQCKVVVLSRYNHVGMKKPLNSIKYLLAWPTQSSNYLCVTHTFTLSILFCKQAKCSFRLSNFGKIWFKFWLIKLPKCDHCDPKKANCIKFRLALLESEQNFQAKSAQLIGWEFQMGMWDPSLSQSHLWFVPPADLVIFYHLVPMCAASHWAVIPKILGNWCSFRLTYPQVLGLNKMVIET